VVEYDVLDNLLYIAFAPTTGKGVADSVIFKVVFVVAFK